MKNKLNSIFKTAMNRGHVGQLHLLSLAAMVLSFSSVVAQSLPPASISPAGAIVLQGAEVSQSYLIDLTAFSFENDGQMIQFFAEKCTSDFTIRAVTQSNQAIVHLATHKFPTRTVSEWNVAFAHAAVSNPIKQ